MSYSNLATGRVGSNTQAPKQQPVLDIFERDIKGNIETICSCARAATEQLDTVAAPSCSRTSTEQHLSKGRNLVMETERLFRDWIIEWAGEPAERCRKRCAHDKLRRALVDATASLSDAARLVAAAQVEAAEAEAQSDAVAAEDAVPAEGDEGEALLGDRGGDRRTAGETDGLLPPWLRSAALGCRSAVEGWMAGVRGGNWPSGTTGGYVRGLGKAGGKDNTGTADGLSQLAAQLLWLREATYKLLGVAATVLVVALTFHVLAGHRSVRAAATTQVSFRVDAAASLGDGIAAFASPAGITTLLAEETGKVGDNATLAQAPGNATVLEDHVLLAEFDATADGFEPQGFILA